MQPQSFRKLSILAAAVMIASLGLAPSARADLLTVTAAEDAGSATTIINQSGSLSSPLGISGSASAQVGDFVILVQGATARQLDNTLSLATGSTSSIYLANGTVGTHTLHLVLTGTGYTAPLSGTILSHIGGSVAVGGANNALTFASIVGSTTVTNPAPTPGVTAPGSFSSDASGTVTGLTTGYSITEDINITLSGNSVINYSSSTTITATPEPATVAMALSALPMIGLGVLARRRRARA